MLGRFVCGYFGVGVPGKSGTQDPPKKKKGGAGRPVRGSFSFFFNSRVPDPGFSWDPNTTITTDEPPKKRRNRRERPETTAKNPKKPGTRGMYEAIRNLCRNGGTLVLAIRSAADWPTAADMALFRMHYAHILIVFSPD